MQNLKVFFFDKLYDESSNIPENENYNPYKYMTLDEILIVYWDVIAYYVYEDIDQKLFTDGISGKMKFYKNGFYGINYKFSNDPSVEGDYFLNLKNNKIIFEDEIRNETIEGTIVSQNLKSNYDFPYYEIKITLFAENQENDEIADIHVILTRIRE